MFQTNIQREVCTSKVCARCHRNKPTEQFYSKGDRIDTRCKECVKKIKAESYSVKIRLARKQARLALRRKERKTKVLDIKSFMIVPIGTPDPTEMRSVVEDYIDQIVSRRTVLRSNYE